MHIKKSHIVIDGAIFALQKSGGISRLWCELLSGLDENFLHSITLLMPRNKNVEWKSTAPSIKNIKVMWRKNPLMKMDLFYLSCVARYLKPSLWLSTYYQGMPSGSFTKVSMLYDMISELFSTSKKESGDKLKTLRAATHIFSISRSTQKDLDEVWPAYSNKVRVWLPGGSCIDRAQKVPRPYFVYVGHRGAYKNFHKMMKVLLSDSRFSNFQFYVVGGGKQFSKEEAHLIQSDKRVIKKEVLLRDTLEDLISNASALLFPSLYEGFGYPVLEAFQLQIPVLACNTSSIPEITGEHYPLVDPRKENYGDVLNQLLNERTRWIDYGQFRARLFTKSEMVNRFKEILSECNLV